MKVLNLYIVHDSEERAVQLWHTEYGWFIETASGKRAIEAQNAKRLIDKTIEQQQ